MKTEQSTNKTNAKHVIIKKCHFCGTIMEGTTEPQRCTKCNKSFLPLNYFSKIHAKNTKEFKNMFAASDELHEDDLIKGLLVLW